MTERRAWKLARAALHDPGKILPALRRRLPFLRRAWRNRRSESSSTPLGTAQRELVVYTVITGDYDRPPTVATLGPGIRCFCFADAITEVPEPWELVRIEPYFRDSKMTSGLLKTNPHLMFPSDSLVTWVDANLTDLQLNAQFLEQVVAEQPVAAPRHRSRTTVAQEAGAVAELGLDEEPRTARLLQTLVDRGYRDDQGLAATMFLVRDLAMASVHQANALWWDGIVRLSRRDQLTFNYSLWASCLGWNEIDVDYEQPNAIFARKDHSRPEGRRLARGVNAAALAEAGRWAAPLRGHLPDIYPEVTIYHEEAWSHSTLELLRALNAAVVATSQPMEGNYCHTHRASISEHTPPDIRRSWKREFLRRASAGSTSALEIGFNAGHSAAVLLGASPQLSLVSVDLGEHDYSRPCAQIVAEHHPGRFDSHWGDSATVLPDLPPAVVSSLDFVHIDGGHGEKAFLSDLRWFMEATPEGCLLVVDDAYVARIHQPLAEACHRAALEELQPGLPSSGENRLYRKLST